MRSSGYWIGATLAFAAELGSLAGLALWGATAPSGWVARVLLGAGLPLAAALLWGAFAAPRARFSATVPAVVVKVAVQGGAVAALVAAGHPWPAAVLGVGAALGAVLTARLTPAAAAPTRSGPAPPAGGSPTG
jgi:hypothetical protein